MSRKKKIGYTPKLNPWIAINIHGQPEKKKNKIRIYMTRKGCEDYIRSREGVVLLTAIKLKDLEIAYIMAN